MATGSAAPVLYAAEEEIDYKTVDDRPANRDLIVVGNRGLGALPGQQLGHVPAEIATHATCDILIVQTTPAVGDTDQAPPPPA